MKSKSWLPVLVLFFVCVPMLGQKEDEAARERVRKITLLCDSLIADSRELRLPENRAVLFVRVGNRLWDSDRERAQELFEEAVGELLAAQAEAEATRKQGSQSELLTGQSTRPQILQGIATRNADFALKSFYRTRPATIERAFLNQNPKDSKIRSAPGSDTYLAQNELNLEQNLVRLAADQNPEKAVALLQTALKKGVTGEALNLLRKLHEQNPAAAAEMASEVTSQLLKKSLMTANQPDYTVMQTSIQFLTEHIRQRPSTDKGFRFAAAEMRPLADKLIAFVIDRGHQFGYSYAQQILQMAEKMRPDTVEKLKELVEKTPAHFGGIRPIVVDQTVNRLVQHDTPIEQVLAEAPKLTVEQRRHVYNNVANRLAGAGNIARARQLINDNFSDDALTNAMESLNWYQAHHLINQGKFTEAEALIDEFPDGNRFSGLIALADAMYNRDQVENKTRAIGVLEKARAALPVRPENSNEMQQLFQLIAAYSRIEPAEAFRMLDGLVPQLNDLIEASAIVGSFQGMYGMRHNELIFSTGNTLGPNIDYSIVRTLAQKDFDRAVSLVGTFSRREVRIMLKQQLLESL